MLSYSAPLWTAALTINSLVPSRWDTLYPLYIDKKRPQQAGGRRVNAKLAIEWPSAEQMAKACSMLGFDTVFEVSRSRFLPVEAGSDMG